MQTGSSGTLIGWISGQTTFVPLWDRMEGAWLRTQECLQFVDQEVLTHIFVMEYSDRGKRDKVKLPGTFLCSAANPQDNC